MASRVVRDTFLSSSTIHLLSPGAQDRWLRYFMLSDYHGCFECLPAIVKAQAFPQRADMTVERVRDDLLEYAREMLEVWTDGGRVYGFWRQFGHHNRISKEGAYRRKTPVPPTVRPYGTLAAYYAAGADRTAPHPRMSVVQGLLDLSPRQLTLLSDSGQLCPATARQLPGNCPPQDQDQVQVKIPRIAAAVAAGGTCTETPDTADAAQGDTPGHAQPASSPLESAPPVSSARPSVPPHRHSASSRQSAPLTRHSDPRDTPEDSTSQKRRAFFHARLAAFETAYRQRYGEGPPPDTAGKTQLGRLLNAWKETVPLDDALSAYTVDSDPWYASRKHALRHFAQWVAEGRHRQRGDAEAAAPTRKPRPSCAVCKTTLISETPRKRETDGAAICDPCHRRLYPERYKPVAAALVGQKASGGVAPVPLPNPLSPPPTAAQEPYAIALRAVRDEFGPQAVAEVTATIAQIGGDDARAAVVRRVVAMLVQAQRPIPPELVAGAA